MIDEHERFQGRFEQFNNNVRCSFNIQRDVWFYFWKVMIVESFISLASVAVFVTAESYISQITYVSTILLTGVSSLYTLNAYLPKLGYLTFLDRFVLSSFFFVLVVLVGTVVIKSSPRLDPEEQDLRGFVFLGIWLLGALYFGATARRAWCRRFDELKKRFPTEEKLQEVYDNYYTYTNFYGGDPNPPFKSYEPEYFFPVCLQVTAGPEYNS